MASQTKLLLIACSGDETAKLTEDISTTLREDYGLEGQVEVLLSQRRAEVDKDTPKAHRHPLVADYFPDAEVQVNIGANELKDVIRGKHVALVEHLLTPCRRVTPEDPQCVSVNDHVSTVRGFLDVISNVETLQRTLVAPYLAYVRSHSVEKYRKKGFFQFDSLRRMLVDFQRDGLNAILTIDPHSEKAAQLAEELGMDYHASNPFQSARAINPYKLGLSGGKAGEVLNHLRPYHERLATMKEQNAHHLYVVSVDDGTEHRTENFVERAFPHLPEEEVYRLIVYFDKDRFSYGSAVTGIKPFSQITEHNIDPKGIYIIIDDMFASGGTGKKAAKRLKEKSV
ncbi:MAG: hypothetical protein AABX37_01795, partial [Nanoarchaeota archaeon]